MHIPFFNMNLKSTLITLAIMQMTWNANAAPPTMADLAGKWTGNFEFTNSSITLEIDQNGSVLGGDSSFGPIAKKGSATINKSNVSDPVTITWYFTAMCQDSAKIIRNVVFTKSTEEYTIDGYMENPCFPASNGWIKLKRKADAGSTSNASPISTQHYQSSTVSLDAGFTLLPGAPPAPAPAKSGGGCFLANP